MSHKQTLSELQYISHDINVRGILKIPLIDAWNGWENITVLSAHEDRQTPYENMHTET